MLTANLDAGLPTPPAGKGGITRASLLCVGSGSNFIEVSKDKWVRKCHITGFERQLNRLIIELSAETLNPEFESQGGRVDILFDQNDHDQMDRINQLIEQLLDC